MESLELPCDILWQSNVESLPLSQLTNAKGNEIFIIEDNFTDESLPLESETDLMIVEVNQDIMISPEHFIELYELESLLSDDDSSTCSSNDQWLDQPIIPSMEEYPAPSQAPRIHPVRTENTDQLLKEFNNVYDKVELTHLTPPETPPQTPPQSFVDASKNEFIYPGQNQSMYQMQQPLQFQPAPVAQPPPISSQISLYEQAINLVASQMPQDIQREIDAVDEIVRSRAESLPDWTDDDCNSVSGASSSSSSSSYSPRSDTYSSSNYSNDDEWNTVSNKKAGGKMKSNKNTDENGKKKTRPYGRSTEDRKHRKKEQNKNAANRYRQRKKAEGEIVQEEEKGLAKKNEELQAEYSDVRREIKYLKDLMRELYTAKGLL